MKREQSRKRSSEERAEFDAFLSYRRFDGARTARSLRYRLQRYRLPSSLQSPGRREPLRVYLDTIYERANEDFFKHEILPRLRASRYFVLVQTPAVLLPGAHGSVNWVVRELREFRALGRDRRLIVAVGCGALDGPLPDGLDQSHPNLERIDLRRGIRQAELLKLVATLHDIRAEEMPQLLREEERRRRLALVRWATVSSVLAVVFLGLALWATSQRGEALAKGRVAESRRLAAESQVHVFQQTDDTGLLPMSLAREAVRVVRESDGIVLPETAATLRRAALNQPKLVVLLGHEAAATCADWADSGALATADTDGHIIVWNVFGAVAVAETRLGTGVHGLEWHAERLVAACEDGSIRLWTPTDGAVPKRVDVHDGCVYSARWSKDGGRILTACQDGNIRTVDVASGVVTSVVEGPRDLRGAEWGPDELLIFASSYSGQHRILTVEGVEKVAFRQLGSEPAIDAACFDLLDDPGELSALCPDASQVAFTSQQRDEVSFADGLEILPRGRIGSVDIRSGINDIRLDYVNEPRTTAIAWDPDGVFLAAGGIDSRIRLIDSRDWKFARTFAPQEGVVTSVSWSEDRLFVASTSADSTVAVWKTGLPGAVPFSPGKDSWRVAYHPGGVDRLLVLDVEGTLRLVDTRSGAVLQELAGDFTEADWAADGRVHTSVGYQGLQIRDWVDLQVEQEIGTDSDALGPSIVTAAVGPDTILTSHSGLTSPRMVIESERKGPVPHSGGSVSLWSSTTLEQVEGAPDVGDTVLCAEWSHDGGRVALGEKGKTARIWSRPENRTLVTFAHDELVTEIRWGPADHYLATRTLSGVVNVWDLSTGQLLFSPVPENRAVVQLAWHPLLPVLLVGTENGELEVWDAPSSHRIFSFKCPPKVRGVGWILDGRGVSAVRSDGGLSNWFVGDGLAPLQELMEESTDEP